MTGLFIKKYHIAVLDSKDGFLENIVNSLKSIYHNKIIIETYKNSHDMFEAVNVNQVKNHPFDLAVLSPSEFVEKFVLKQSNPQLPVILCKDEQGLKMEASKVLL